MAEPVEKPKSAFSGWPMIIGVLAMLIFAIHASTHMVAAGDTWVALACGRHFWNHGVNTVEPFSANTHKAGPTAEEIKTWPDWAQKLTDKVGLKTVQYWHPTGWVNQNWLTHVIFYWLAYKSPIADAANYSFNSLVYWKFTIYILAVFCVYLTARLLGANRAFAVIFACFALFTGRSFLDIRPAGFSNLLVSVFLLILILTSYRNILYIWLIVPLAVFWCNVHGGYIYLFIMLVPFVFFHLITAFSKKRFVSIGFRGLKHTIGAGITAFLAMVIFNPFHLTNLTHTLLISVSKHAEMWRTVNEWHPAFEWENPVGTGFPFFILVVTGSIALFLWVFSFLLKPRHITAPKNILDNQKKTFQAASKIFGYAAAIFITWIILISCSMLGLDLGSFLIAALFAVILILSIYKNLNFVYLIIPLVVAGLWTEKSGDGYQGRYIYPFILIPAYVLLYAVASAISRDLKIKLFNIIPVILTAAAALVLMIVIFNPFKFEPLWNISQLINLQRIWSPRYELISANKLDYQYLFPALYLLNLGSIAVWLVLPYLLNGNRQENQIKNKSSEAQAGYQLPKVDLALIAIGILTVYMALRSRRFIPIAAVIACPFIAMFLSRTIEAVSAAFNFYRTNSFTVPSMSSKLRMFIITSGTVLVLFFGIFWGHKFKTVYLDPWPKDEKLNSIFIRMTSSDVKPFYACEFMRDNKMSGNMFNYWTEGGFIAWGQDPDPVTGKTPLQLFIDGRAQAAYEPQVYTQWGTIMAGGSYAAAARMRGEDADYKKVGEWVDGQLRKNNVWVVLMPSDQFSSPFLRGLETNPNWIPVFNYDEQKMYVDIRTEQGKKLLEGVADGRTIYRDNFYRDVILADALMQSGNASEQEYDLAVQAFKAKPCRTSILGVLSAIKYSNLREKMFNFCKDYFEEFEKNKEVYSKQDGYYYKIVAALYSVIYLQDIAEAKQNRDLAELCQLKRIEYSNDISAMFSKILW